MTIMYTIGCIVMSLAFTLAFYNIVLMFERKRKVCLLPILVIVGVLLVLFAARMPALDRYYEAQNPHSYQDLFPEAYKEGYQDAISEAILTEVNDYEYIISFNGEAHYYAH